MRTQKPSKLSTANPMKAPSNESPLSSPEQKNPYKDFKILGKLADSSFSLFLTQSDTLQKNFIMKAFPYSGTEVNKHFIQESRLLKLQHPNVVRLYDSQPLKKGYSDSKKIYISYVLMEYAPYGDFCEMLMKGLLPKDEKLARTYVKQLVEGVEYIHKKGIYHMDLKLDNLLVGDDFSLKITDFDSCFSANDTEFLGTGSEDYRAPEVKKGSCRNPIAADIYSVAIIMFALTMQSFPYSEKRTIKGFDLFDLLMNQPEVFWDALNQVHSKSLRVSQDFKSLFMSMVTKDPQQRATIQDIKRSNWYQGSVYTKKELKSIMSRQYKNASQQ